MSKETEKLIRELQKYMDEHEGEVDFDDLFKGGPIPFSLPEQKGRKAELDAYDYLEMAENSGNGKEAVRYAKKALAMEPTLLDAEILLAQMKEPMAAKQKALEKVMDKGKKQLEEQGISFTDDAGDFYMIFETRPYIRASRNYMEVLKSQGKMRKAVAVGEEVLRLNDNDNTGARYTLMALYAYLEEPEKAEALLERYDHEESVNMLLPMIALYYKLDEEKTAKQYLKKLRTHTEGLREAFEAIERDKVDWDEVEEAPFYQPFTAEEVYIAYAGNRFLYENIPGFVNWVVKGCPKKRK